MNIGDEYMYEDHIGKITALERLGDEVFVVVHLPTMPEGKQWLTTHGPSEDFQEEYLQ